MHLHFGRCGPDGRRLGPRGWHAGGRGGFDRGGAAMEWDVRRGGREGGRSRRMFDGSELRLLLLKLIADEPRHGYDLIRQIETLTGGAYAPSPGVVYPTLTMLDEMDQIEEQHADGTRKRFQITDAGREHLAENQAVVDALMERLRGLGGDTERLSGSPIGRAMRNLGMAVRHKAMRGDMSADGIHDVAALIDALTQKIERLK